MRWVLIIDDSKESKYVLEFLREKLGSEMVLEGKSVEVINVGEFAKVWGSFSIKLPKLVLVKGISETSVIISGRDAIVEFIEKMFKN